MTSDIPFLQLAVDTGSFAVIIEEGKYKSNPTSQQTNQGEFIQFNGASEDGIQMAFVSSCVSLDYPLSR